MNATEHTPNPNGASAMSTHGMTEAEAYPNTYLERKNAWYNPGDKVKVGPAFRQGGRYFADGAEGLYTVLCREPGDFYFLIKGDIFDLDGWHEEDVDASIYVSRITKR
jgi:hypothetical protein